jgi:endo-1,4-beta-D-glucanase Y
MSSISGPSGPKLPALRRIINTGKTVIRTAVLGTSLIAPTAIVGYYVCKGLSTDRPNIEYSIKTTDMTEPLNKSWKYWKTSFTQPLADGSLFVTDPSENNRIVSEGMAYGLLMAVQNNDREIFDRLARGLTKMEGRGMPAWRAFIENGELVVRSDSEWSSASDADQDIAFAFIQAYSLWGKSSCQQIAQSYLDRFWDGNVQYDGNSAILKPSEDWGGSTASSGVIYNVSYPSLVMLEAFDSFDANPNHKWKKLMSDTLILREKIISAGELRTGVEETIAKKPYSEIPDWVEVSWTPEGGISLYISSGRSYKTGYDAIRTLWRIALDAELLKDPNARKRTIELARKMMDAIPEDIAIFDENGAEQKDTEIALAAYTALAYAASDKRYPELKEKLKKIQREDGSFSSGRDDQAPKRYYVQSTAWICGQILDGVFGRFVRDRFKDNPGKTIQELKEKHRPGYLLHTEYVPELGGHGLMVDPSERAELDLMKKIIYLYDESHGSSDTLAVRISAARELKGQLHLDEAINQYMLILGKSPLRAAQTELDGTLSESGLPPEHAVSLYRKMLESNANNPYVKLGLAMWLVETYNPFHHAEALRIAEDLTKIKEGAAGAYFIIARIKMQQANNLAAIEKMDESRSRMLEALAAVTSGLGFEKDPELNADLYFLKGEIEHKSNLLNNAIDSFKHLLSPKISDPKFRIKALIALCSCYRDTKEPNNLTLALSLIDGELQFHKRKKSDPDYIRLKTERLRILRDQHPDPKSITAVVMTDFTDIINESPSGRLITAFERVLYFLGKGETLKAKKDAQQLLDLGKMIKNPADLEKSIIPDAEIAELKAIEKYIRTELLPKRQEITPDMLIKRIEKLASGHRAELLALAENNHYEDIAEKIERLEELNTLLREYRDKIAAGKNLDKQVGILEMAGKILDALDKDQGIKSREKAETIAKKAVEKCKKMLHEKTLTPKWFEEFLEFYREAVWILNSTGNRAGAVSLLKELLNDSYFDTTLINNPNDLLFKALRALRDPEVRGGINSIIGGRADIRANLFMTLGQLFAIDQNPRDALRAYRQSLGFSPDAPNQETEEKEYNDILKSKPESAKTLGYMANIADENRSQMIHRVLRGEQ